MLQSVGSSRKQESKGESGERRLEAAAAAMVESRGNTVSQWLSHHNLGSLVAVPICGRESKEIKCEEMEVVGGDPT